MMKLAEREIDRTDAMYSRATVLFDDGRDLKEAEDIFLQLIAEDPEFDGVLEQLFQLYMSTKEYEKAMHWAEAMYQLEGAEHCGLLNKGELPLVNLPKPKLINKGI